MKKSIIMMAAFMMASGAYATTVAEGTQEISLAGSFIADTPAGTDSSLSLGYGKFVRDQWAVGGLFKLADNDTGSAYAFGAYTEYNFEMDSPWTPYVGFTLAWGHGNPSNGESNDAFVGSPSVGCKYFINDTVALFGQFEYDLASDDIYTDEDLNPQSDNYGIELGIRIYIP